MRATLITTGSVVLTSAVIGNAFYHKKQFYPSVVYITKSNPSMAVVYIQCIVMFLLIGKLMRQIFFGTLRAAELEHLIERGWYAVTETCLAFTVFREDLNARFVGLFAVLLFLKCFHWMAEDRVDFMERTPNINILFHVRIVSLLTVLATCDMTFIYFAYSNIITKSAGSQLAFGFEYAILLASILNIVMKYILHWIDIASDSPWDEKAVCLLYTELVMSIIKVSLYLIFVFAMLKDHQFPLFALRPIYLSLRTLKKALSDVIMSRRAIRNMNTLYPNATQEELANTDNVCIICREEMIADGTSKKLPCNHIFHVSCLRSWFQRQQTCPTCRMEILRYSNNNANQQSLTRNNNQPRSQPAVSTGSNSSASAVPGATQTSQNQQPPPVAAAVQAQVILQDQMAVVMVQTFAQMFVEAIITHLQALNLNQPVQQPPRPQPQQQPQEQEQQNHPSDEQHTHSKEQQQPVDQYTQRGVEQKLNSKEGEKPTETITRDASTQTDDPSNGEVD